MSVYPKILDSNVYPSRRINLADYKVDVAGDVENVEGYVDTGGSTTSTSYVLMHQIRAVSAFSGKAFRRVREKLATYLASGTFNIKIVYYDGVNEYPLKEYTLNNNTSYFDWFSDYFYTDGGYIRVYGKPNQTGDTLYWAVSVGSYPAVSSIPVKATVKPKNQVVISSCNVRCIYSLSNLAYGDTVLPVGGVLIDTLDKYLYYTSIGGNSSLIAIPYG